MAGSAVEGGAVSKDKENKKNPTIFREEEDLEELEEDRGVRGDLPAHPSGRDADDEYNEKDENGKQIGPKFSIAKEQVDIGEVLNYLLETGVSE